MKNIQFIIILVILLAICLMLNLPESSEKAYLKRINQLELKLDSLKTKKDSIRTVIDSTHVKIITNEKHYQERINTIINQSSSADSGFIADYIRLYTNKNPLLNIE